MQPVQRSRSVWWPTRTPSGSSTGAAVIGAHSHTGPLPSPPWSAVSLLTVGVLVLAIAGPAAAASAPILIGRSLEGRDITAVRVGRPEQPAQGADRRQHPRRRAVQLGRGQGAGAPAGHPRRGPVDHRHDQPGRPAARDAQERSRRRPQPQLPLPLASRAAARCALLPGPAAAVGARDPGRRARSCCVCARSSRSGTTSRTRNVSVPRDRPAAPLRYARIAHWPVARVRGPGLPRPHRRVAAARRTRQRRLRGRVRRRPADGRRGASATCAPRSRWSRNRSPGLPRAGRRAPRAAVPARPVPASTLLDRLGASASALGTRLLPR